MAPRQRPISVIVPVHNRPDLAARCLESLDRWQEPLDVIVIDDGSSDPGVDALRRSRGSRERWLSNSVAQGFSRAVNQGLETASGDPLLLLNSDAEVTSGGDLAMLAGFDAASARSKPVGAVAARLVFPDGRPQWSGGSFPSLLWLFALASGLGAGARQRWRRAPPSGFVGGPVDWAPGAALAIARAAYEQVGRFDESYRHYGQDLDYASRLARIGHRVVVSSDFVVVHHLGATVARQTGDTQRSDGARHAGQRLDLLWLDLLRWAHVHRPTSWARRARLCLALGGRLRLLRLASRRDAPEARAVAAALTALEQNCGGEADPPR